MIARELLVKLGFNIDAAKFAQFNIMSEDVKAKMSSVQKAVSSSLSPDVREAFKKLSAYNQELKVINGDERKDILELNRLEKQAIKQVTQSHRQQHKELEALEKARLARIQKNREEFQGLVKGIGNIAKGITLVTGAVSAGFALSLKSTLDDVKAFKGQKFHGEKTTSKFDKGQLKAVDEFNSSFDETKRIIAEVRNSFVIGLLPVISEVSKKFQGWVKLNRELINSKLKSAINGITQGIKGLSLVVGNVTNALGGWQKILSAVKVGIAGLAIYKFAGGLFSVYQNLKLVKTVLSASLNFKALFSPITMISAALTGLFLVLEDFYVFSKGGKSVIGDIVNSDSWKKFKEHVESVTRPIEKLLETLGMLENKKAPLLEKTTAGGLKIFKVQEGEERNKFLSSMRTKSTILNSDQETGAGRLRDLNINDNFKRFEPSPRMYEPRIVKSSPTFNTTLTINVPQGTTRSQAEDITRLVRSEIEKAQVYSYEKMLNAVGGT